MKARYLPLALLALAATRAEAADARDFTATGPLTTSGAINGNLLTNDTELLTPQGIIDAPPPLTLTKLPDNEPDPAAIEPAAGPTAPSATPSAMSPSLLPAVVE